LIGHPDGGSEDLFCRKIEGRRFPAALTDLLDPKTIAAGPRPKIEAATRRGDGAGVLMPALVQHDDERFRQR
jgi:hypothetical protein